MSSWCEYPCPDFWGLHSPVCARVTDCVRLGVAHLWETILTAKELGPWCKQALLSPTGLRGLNEESPLEEFPGSNMEIPLGGWMTLGEKSNSEHWWSKVLSRWQEYECIIKSLRVGTGKWYQFSQDDCLQDITWLKKVHYKKEDSQPGPVSWSHGTLSLQVTALDPFVIFMSVVKPPGLPKESHTWES